MTNPTELPEADQFEADVGVMRVARVYAEAMLDAAGKENKSDDVLQELRDFIDGVLAPNPALAEFFANSPLRESGLKVKRSKDKLRSPDL